MPRRPLEEGAPDSALGRSRRGLSTKIHLAVDALGRPIRVLLTGGPRNDITKAQALLAGLAPRHVLADKGYDSRALIEVIQAQGADAVILPRSCQQTRAHDKAKYRLRNRVERCFVKLKQWRRIATRYDRKPTDFLSGHLDRVYPHLAECRFSLVSSPASPTAKKKRR